MMNFHVDWQTWELRSRQAEKRRRTVTQLAIAMMVGNKDILIAARDEDEAQRLAGDARAMLEGLQSSREDS